MHTSSPTGPIRVCSSIWASTQSIWEAQVSRSVPRQGSIEAGEEIVVWDLEAAREAEKSVIVPVVVLEADAENLTLAEAGPISASDALIRIG